jgi:RNase P/RNase MRP subunit POP5
MKRVLLAILVVLAAVAGMGTGFSVRDATTQGTKDFSDTEGFTGAQLSASSLGWELQNPPPQWSTLYGVWGNSSSDVFAVADYGAILHYNGSAWSPMTSGTTNTLYGIWADSSYIYVVGESGTIRRCAVGSTTWSAMTSGTTAQLNGVWGDSSYIYVVGTSGTIRRCPVGSTTWSAMTSGTTAQLNGVWGDSSYIYVVGTSGTIRRCAVSSTTWNGMTSVTTAHLNGVWGDSSYVYVVGESGTIRRCAVGSTTWNGMTSGTTNSLYGIWGDSLSNVFAVGAAGASQLLHYDGSTWHGEWIFDGYGADLRDIWGTSPSDIFAVGYATVLHGDGSESGWHYSIWDSSTHSLVSVWGSSPGNVLTIGPWGARLQYNGSNWSVIAGGHAPMDDMEWETNCIWGSCSSDVFVVGTEVFGSPLRAEINHYDGSTWTKTTLDIDDELYGIWGSSATDVFARGRQCYPPLQWQRVEPHDQCHYEHAV